MKFTEIKKAVKKADDLIGKSIFDCRYNDLFKIEQRKGNFFKMKYGKGATRTESVSFVFYHIERGQYILPVEPSQN